MKSKSIIATTMALASGLFLFSACQGGPSGIAGLQAANVGGTAAPSGNPPPKRAPGAYKTDALLYDGAGVWSAEVPGLEQALTDNGESYTAVDDKELNAMSVDELAQYGMIVWPGGNGSAIMSAIQDQTKVNLMKAVQERGVGYIGFCAGAFIAVSPPPAAGQVPSYGIGVVSGSILDYYYLENQGTDIAMTMESFADGSKRDLVWYGGPFMPDAPGTVVAKYPDGTAAITQAWSGNGFVTLSGPHPAAPQAIRDEMGLHDSDGLDIDLAARLLKSTLTGQKLRTF